MRIKNIINNAVFSSSNMMLNLILTFVYRTIFIQTLGVEYLGLSALYTNILMMLSLAELGVGQAIAFSLYKPISVDDTVKINMLVGLYKKVYRYIGYGVLTLGLCMMPFISYLMSSAVELENIYLIFLLFLFNSSLTYFWGYKRTLIIAHQLEYKLVPFLAVSQIIDIGLRIACLLITQSFVLALLVQLIVKLIENIVINKYIDKKYDYITTKANKIDKRELKTITTNVKAMIMHKLGDFFVNGTDNIIVSSFIGLSVLGLYSNYTMLTAVVTTFLMLIFNATSASLGNVIAKESIGRTEELFRVINFLSYWLFGWTSICFYILIQPFITIWLGSDYILDEGVIILLSINLFVFGTRVSLGVVKAAGGIYDQDKYSPIVQGVVNLIFSIVLVQYLGLKGVLIGTLVSSLLVPLWHRPYIVYKHLFKSSPRKYFESLSIFTLIIITSALTTRNLINLSTSDSYSALSNFAIALGLCFVIPNGLIVILFCRTKEFFALTLYVKRYLLKVC